MSAFSPLPQYQPAQLLLSPGQACVLLYRAPGTSAEFRVKGVVEHIVRHGPAEYVRLVGGYELPLAWLVAVDGQRLAA